MSEAYTKLGIEIEVGKVVTVDKKNVEAKAQEVAKAFNDAIGKENLFGKLADGIAELTSKLGSLDFSKITKGLTDINNKANELKNNAKDTQGAVENQINSIAKRMEAVLGVSAEKVKKELKTAFQFEGVEQGLGKLSKIKDMFVEVQGKVYSLKTEMDKIGKDGVSPLTSLLAPGSDTEFSLFSKKRLQADVDRFKQELLKIKDFAEKNGQSNISALAGLQKSADKFFSGDLKSIKDLEVLKQKALELKGVLERGVGFKALDTQAEALVRRFSSLQGSTPFDKLKNLSSADYDDSVRGLFKYESALKRVTTQLEALNKVQKDGRQQAGALGLNERETLKYNSYANRDADGAYNAYRNNLTKLSQEERKLQEENGKQLLAVLKNTRTAEKAERDKALQEWQQYLSALRNSGQQYYNGAVVPKSYITDINNARAAAEAEATRRSSRTATSQIIDPIKAESLARVEQAFRVVEELKRQSNGAAVEASKMAEALRRAGINTKDLDDKSANRLRAAIAQLGVAVNTTTNAFSNNTKQTSLWAQLFGESIGKMAARLTEFYSLRTIIFAVGTQFRDATRASLDFNQSVHDILGISGDSKDRFGAIGASIWEVAKASRYTAAEVSQLMQVLAQAGVSSKDLPAASQQVGMFATATATDPKLAADLFTTAKTNFEIPIERASRITNALTAALNESKLEANGLATAFNYLAPQAAQLGISMEKTLAMIATQAQAGIKPSTIGTGMSQMLKEFAAPKARLKSMLDYYGLRKEDIDPTKKSIAEIVDALNNAKGKANEAGVQVNHLFSALESRVGRSTITTIHLGGDAFRRMEYAITGTSAALIAYDKTMEGARARINVVKQTLHELVSNTLEKMAPLFILLTDSVRGFLTFFGAIPAQVAAATLGLGTAAVAIGGLTKALMTLKLSVAAGTASSAGGWVAGVLGLSSTPVGWIVGAIALISAGLVGLGYWLDSNKRKQEEARKEELLAIEVKQKYKNILTDAAVAAERTTPALKKYEEMLLKHGATNTKVQELGKTNVKLSAEQVIALNKLRDAHPDLIGQIDAATFSYAKQYEIRKKLEKMDYDSASKAAKEYNAKLSDIKSKYKTQQEIIDNAKANSSSKVLTSDDPSSRLRQRLGATQVTDAKKAQARLEAEANSAEMKELKAKALDKALAEVVVGKKGKIQSQITAWSPKEERIGDMRFTDLAEEKTVETSISTGGEITAASSTPQQQAVSKANANLESLQLRLKLLKTKAKDLPATIEEVKMAQKAAFELLPAINQAEKEKIYADIDAKYKGKKGVDSTKVQELIATEKANANTELQIRSATETKFWSDVLSQKDGELNKYADAATKAELDAEKKVQDASQKGYEAILQSKITDYRKLMEAYDAERISIAKEFAAKRKQADADADKEYRELPSTLKGADRDAAYESIDKKFRGTVNGINADEQKAVTEALTKLSSATGPNIAGLEKAADTALRYVQTALSLKKEQAWTTEEVTRLEAQSIQAQIDYQQKKNAVYTEFLTMQKQIEQDAIARINADKSFTTDAQRQTAITLFQEKHKQQVADTADKIKEGAQALEGYKVKLKEVSDTSFSGNFLQGMRSSLQSMGDFASMTKDLGKSLTDSFTSGLSSTVSNTFSTLFNPDQQKIAEAQAKITELTTQRATLEADIKTIEANSSKTPEEIKNLNEKKVALDNVNNSLKEQEAAVRKQKDAWSTFSEGLKGIMKTILETLQKYIAEMLVVWAVQKMIGLVGDMLGSATSSSPALDLGSSGQSTGIVLGGGTDYAKLLGGNTGGLFTGTQFVKGYANGGTVDGLLGGMVPLNMGILGKDSVPAILEPGEVIIKKSSVDYYGADKLLALNQGKIAKFAEGGMVGGGASFTEANKKQEFTLQIVNVANPDQIPKQPVDAQQVLNIISYSAAQRGAVYKTVKGIISS